MSLLSECSVSVATERCFVTQAAMSNTLAALRDLFDDPLLIRQGKRMLPTPKALELKPKITELMRQLENIVSDERFNPRTSDKVFTLALADHGHHIILPKFVRLCQSKAPNVRLNVIDYDTRFGIKAFEDNQIDIAIAIEAEHLQGLCSVSLYTERPVCVTRRKCKLTLADYKKSDHVAVKYNLGAKYSFVDSILKKQEIDRRVIVTLPSLPVALDIIMKSNYIGTFPSVLCEHLQKTYKYHIQPTPFKVPKSDVSLLWQKRLANDPANRWLRELIISCI